MQKVNFEELLTRSRKRAAHVIGRQRAHAVDQPGTVRAVPRRLFRLQVVAEVKVMQLDRSFSLTDAPPWRPPTSRCHRRRRACGATAEIAATDVAGLHP